MDVEDHGSMELWKRIFQADISCIRASHCVAGSHFGRPEKKTRNWKYPTVDEDARNSPGCSWHSISVPEKVVLAPDS